MQVRQTAKENKIRKCDHLFKMSGLGRKLFMIISILEHWVSTSFLSRLLLLFLPCHKKSALSALLNGGEKGIVHFRSPLKGVARTIVLRVVTKGDRTLFIKASSPLSPLP